MTEQDETEPLTQVSDERQETAGNELVEEETEAVDETEQVQPKDSIAVPPSEQSPDSEGGSTPNNDLSPRLAPNTTLSKVDMTLIEMEQVTEPTFLPTTQSAVDPYQLPELGTRPKHMLRHSAPSMAAATHIETLMTRQQAHRTEVLAKRRLHGKDAASNQPGAVHMAPSDNDSEDEAPSSYSELTAAKRSTNRKGSKRHAKEGANHKVAKSEEKEEMEPTLGSRVSHSSVTSSISSRSRQRGGRRSKESRGSAASQGHDIEEGPEETDDLADYPGATRMQGSDSSGDEDDTQRDKETTNEYVVEAVVVEDEPSREIVQAEVIRPDDPAAEKELALLQQQPPIQKGNGCGCTRCTWAVCGSACCCILFMLAVAIAAAAIALNGLDTDEIIEALTGKSPEEDSLAPTSFPTMLESMPPTFNATLAPHF